jgi:hypothetical protein
MWSFQMMYMIPIRRALACSLPHRSVAKASSRKSRAIWRSFLFRAARVQSNARPSLCSEVPELRQDRAVGPWPPPRLTSHLASALVPGLAYGEHFFCGWYSA